MRLLLLFSAFFFATSLHSAEAISPWGDHWEIAATDEGCSLTLEFSNERADETNSMVGTDYEIFDRFYMWFYIPSFTKEKFHNIQYIKNELHFSLTSQRHPMVNEDQRRIDSAQLNGVELPRPWKSAATSYRQYFLQGREAHEILNMLNSEDKVILDLGLSGGETESIWVPSGPSQYFNVWSKLLFVCADEINSAPERL
jgi:hypothetical protein